MSIRAKFHCDFKARKDFGGGYTSVDVVLSPRYGYDGKDNEEWSSATPSGKIELTITNPDAAEAFQPGNYYFIDFTPAN